MSRRLVLIAYDISNARRLRRAHKLIKEYAVGGQKSVFECFVTRQERQQLKEGLGRIINHREDRVHIFQLHGGGSIHTLGRAIAPRDPPFFYIG